MCIHAAVYFPPHTPPSAISAGPTEGYFTCANRSEVSATAERTYATTLPLLSAVVHFPAVLLPSAASVGPAEGYFTCAN
jgi:hypothetical protein